MKKLITFSLFLFVLAFTSRIDAWCLERDITLVNSYRHDLIQSLIYAYNPPGTLVLTDDLKARNLCMYQFGGKVWFKTCGWVTRFEGDYAWGNKGKYRDTVTQEPSGIESVQTSDVCKVRAKDFSFGTGYLFICLNPCFSLGPVGGWSFNQQKFHTGSALVDGVFSPALSRLTYSNQWKGPWLGVDAVWHSSCFDLYTGYEFHLGKWHASYELARRDVQGGPFSDNRRSDSAHASVFYIDGKYRFCGWTLGVGFRFANWRATHGCETPSHTSFANLGLPNEEDKVKHARWRTYTVSLDMGYFF